MSFPFSLKLKGSFSKFDRMTSFECPMQSQNPKLGKFVQIFKLKKVQSNFTQNFSLWDRYQESLEEAENAHAPSFLTIPELILKLPN